MKVKFRWAPLLAVVGVVCLVAGLFSPGGAGIRLLSDATRPLHRPGDSVVYTSLPDSQKWVNPDGQATDKPHMCAGRDLLYNVHVDAGYVTRNAQGALDVMAVNNTKVLPMDEMCMRLPPDSFNGQEVSRFVVPDDPNLRFLGEPGTIVWRAPFENYGGQWLPVWAGLGAFDAHHEWQVPSDFVSNSVELTLAGFDGPGEMNIFNYLPGWDRAKRIISSKELHTTALDVGGHGHMNWTFSEPGVYRVVWQAQGRHYDGSVERSAPVEQYWLVGEDGQVGLAPGTTKGTRGYGLRAEFIREKMGLKEPTQEAAPVTVGDRPVVKSAEQIKAMVDENFEMWPRAAISAGDVELGVLYDAEENSVSTATRRGTEELPHEVLIEVPDSSARCVAADDPVLGSIAQTAGHRFFWTTGDRGGQTPSFSVDTTGIRAHELSPQEVMVDSGLNGPRDGVFAVGLAEGDAFDPQATNAHARTRSVQLVGQKKHQLRYMMSSPGVYSESGTVMVYGKHKSNYDWYSPVFLVGNQVINAWREKAGVAEKLPESTLDCSAAAELKGRDPFKEVPGDGGGNPGPVSPTTPPSGGTDGDVDGGTDGDVDGGADGGTDGGTETAPSEGSEDIESSGNPTAEPSPSETQPGQPEPDTGDDTGDDTAAEDGAETLHRIGAGHIDLALGTVDGQGLAYVKDDSDPTSPVRRDSGTVAIVVPERAWHRASETAHVPGFEQGAYVLPEVQERRLPWPGLSNEAFDFHGVDPDNQTTTFRIADVLKAPEGGRLMMGATEDMKLVNQLDTEDLSRSLVLPPRTHAHKAFWFTKPGTYQVEYEYSWYDTSGEVQRAPLVVTFEVGSAKDAPTPGGPDGGEVTEPQPKPAPSKPAPSKPAPSKPAPSKPAPSKPARPGQSPDGPTQGVPGQTDTGDTSGDSETGDVPSQPGHTHGHTPGHTHGQGGVTEGPTGMNNNSRGYVPPGAHTARTDNGRQASPVITPVRSTGPAAAAPARAAKPGGPAPKGASPAGQGTPPPPAGQPRPLPPSDPRVMAQQPGIEADIAGTSQSAEFWRGLMLGIGGLSILGALFLFAHTLGRKSAVNDTERYEEAEHTDE